MPTGSAFAAFNLKQLLGWQDLGTRGLAAIRASHVEATQARWDVDGVFNTKLTIDSPGVSQIRINGASKATDGLGHVLTISAAYKNVANFQNTNAIVYHVGFMYAEVPSGLRINPRTGKPQFDRYVEEVGFAAAPTSVTDNGNGTITFNVNSVTEAAVSNAGRLVRVYKVVPADGALTFATALEECTVAFGANNTITTVGKFGQTTVSTTAGDYIVVCMGPRVARNTDLSLVSGVVYVGTVTGNGGTPGTFSNAAQTVLKTFVDATQVAYTPAGWLAPGATNVQLALDALVNGLQASTPSGVLSGANRIGVYAPDWAAVASGGIGNVADANFTTSATVKDLGLALDRAVKRRWSWFVKNDGSFSDADDATGTSITNSLTGRPTWARTLNNAATTPYTWGSDSAGAALGSYIMGEFSDITQANPHLRYTRTNQTSGQRAVSAGKWQRLWLDAAPSSYYRFGGSAQRSGGVIENCGFNGGALLLEACASTTNIDWGFHFRNSVVIPKAETTKAWSASVRFGAVTSAFIWSVWENMLVYGPDAAQTSPAGAGYALLINSQITAPINAATVAAQSRPFVFRDTVFINQRATDTTVALISSDHPVVFDNCRFFGFAGHAAGSAVAGAAGANVTMRDCIIFDPEGMCVDFAPSGGLSGVMENCVMVAGIGGSSTITAPFAFWVNGNTYGMAVNDCTIILGAVMFRANASATTTPLIKIGNTSNAGTTCVRNLNVKVEGANVDLGWANVVSVVNHLSGATGAGTFVDGLFVNLNGQRPINTSSNSILAFSGSATGTRCVIRNFVVNNIGYAATTAFGQSILDVGSYVNGQCWTIQGPSVGAGTVTVRDYVRFNIGNVIDDLVIQSIAAHRFAVAAIQTQGSDNVFSNVRSNTTITPVAVPTKANFMYMFNDRNHLRGLFGSFSTTGVPAVVVEGKDNVVSDGFMDTSNTTSAFYGVVFPVGAGNHRNKFIDMGVLYDGTTSGAVQMLSTDSLVDSCTFSKIVGATAPVANVAAGSVTGSIINATGL